MKPNETIFALATAAGRSAVAVVRISGTRTRAAVDALAGGAPRPRFAALRTLRSRDAAVLDKALVLWFPAPGSYTGEDAAELHLHGGRAVVDSVLSALSDEGLRLADPGEFTRRAYQNGKLDLTQAEAVADLVDAETEAQRRQALGQLGGQLSQRYDVWREHLLDASAWLEAALDFPDEDLPEVVTARARPVLETLREELHAALTDSAKGERVRSGYRIALVGEPNAGKSSLLNALMGRDAAIVTPIAGTTRDVIEGPINLGGYSVILGDTAGLRSTEDVIEAEGVRRAVAWAVDADLRLWIVDASAPLPARPHFIRPSDLVVLNKSDLPAVVTDVGSLDRIIVSAFDATSAELLRAALVERVVSELGGAEFPSATRRRHAQALREALARLDNAMTCLSAPELAAEDVRLAARSLERVTGRVEVEEVLGRVFSTFCIGK